MAPAKRFALDMLDRPVPLCVGNEEAATFPSPTLQRVSRKRTLFVNELEDEIRIHPPTSFLLGGTRTWKDDEWPRNLPYDITSESSGRVQEVGGVARVDREPIPHHPPLHASLARAQSATLSAPPDLTFAVLFSQGQVAANREGNTITSTARRRTAANTASRQPAFELEQEGRPPWLLLSFLWSAACDVVDEASREAMQQAREFMDYVSGACHRRGMRWLDLSRALKVADLPVELGSTPHNSGALIRADMPRLQGAPNDKASIEAILRSFCDMYPGVGYNQVKMGLCTDCACGGVLETSQLDLAHSWYFNRFCAILESILTAVPMDNTCASAFCGF